MAEFGSALRGLGSVGWVDWLAYKHVQGQNSPIGQDIQAFSQCGQFCGDHVPDRLPCTEVMPDPPLFIQAVEIGGKIRQLVMNKYPDQIPVN